MKWNSTRGSLRHVLGPHRIDPRLSQLIWNTCSPCPVARTEAACAQVGHEFFVIGGYRELDNVSTTLTFWIERRARGYPLASRCHPECRRRMSGSPATVNAMSTVLQVRRDPNVIRLYQIVLCWMFNTAHGSSAAVA